MRLLVSMGQRVGGRPKGALRPVLLELQAETGEERRSLALAVDPAWSSGPEADDECTRPTLTPTGELLQPTHTAVHRIDLNAWRVVDRYSHPALHNIHSVAMAPDGGFVLSSASTESVLQVDRDGVLQRRVWLDDGAFEAAHPGMTDLRTHHHDAFKPHRHHPNCAWFVGDALWVTCFETRAAYPVDRPSHRIVFDGIPHDGALQEGLLWFTLVDGRVVAHDPQTLERRVSLDLRALTGTDRLLGWCRGVAVHGDRLWVGMTQLRSTTHREVLRVLLRGERGRKLPSRVVEVDLAKQVIVREIQVGNTAGCTIYGLTLAGA